MDRKRTVLVVGLCIILAAGLSGCVNPTQENNETNTDGTNNGAGTNGGGDGGGSDGDGSGTTEEIDVDTENMTVTCDVQESTTERDSIYSQAGPRFDPRQAEAMLHRELNNLRTTHGNDEIEPLLCDPNLREIAQEHSRVMEEFGFIGPEVPKDEVPEDRNVTTNPEYGNLSVRYEGVCRGVTEVYGRWLYQRNKDVSWNGGELQQRDSVEVISNHDELVRDMRGVWVNDREDLSNPLKIAELRIVNDGENAMDTGNARESMEYLTDANYTRQGIGMHINRGTREVYVTQVLC